MLKEAVNVVLSGRDISTSEMQGVAEEIFSQVNPIQSAALLALLRSKGESGSEILGIIEYLMQRVTPIQLPFSCIDIAGTGGDESNSVNISTGAAILTAA